MLLLDSFGIERRHRIWRPHKNTPEDRVLVEPGDPAVKLRTMCAAEGLQRRVGLTKLHSCSALLSCSSFRALHICAAAGPGVTSAQQRDHLRADGRLARPPGAAAGRVAGHAGHPHHDLLATGHHRRLQVSFCCWLPSIWSWSFTCLLQHSRPLSRCYPGGGPPRNRIITSACLPRWAAHAVLTQHAGQQCRGTCI